MSRRLYDHGRKYTRTTGIQTTSSSRNKLSRESLYRGNFKALERAFDDAKKDRFGCVGKLDLIESIEKVTGLREYIDEISRLMSQADTHDDGRVSYEHYMQAIEERKQAIDEDVSPRSLRRTRKSPKRISTRKTTKTSNILKITSSNREEDDNSKKDQAEDTELENLIRLKVLMQKPSFKNKIELRFLRSRAIDPPRLFRLIQSMVKHHNIEPDSVRTLVRQCQTNYVNKISLDSLYRACRVKKKERDSAALDTPRTDATASTLGSITPRRPMTASSASTTSSVSNVLKMIQDELKFSIGLERLRKAFVQSDTRRSGAAEISALRRNLKRMDLHSGNEALELFLQYCDSRGDGEVTYGNFIKALREEKDD